jgi:hypothetical protein
VGFDRKCFGRQRVAEVLRPFLHVHGEIVDVRSHMADLAANGSGANDATLVKKATLVIRAETELVPVIETVRYAVADRIDQQEAICSERTQAPKRK